MESRVRQLVESPCRALNGNQDPPGPIEYRHISCRKMMNGAPGYFTPYYGFIGQPGVPDIANNFDAANREWTLYSGQSDTESYNEGGNIAQYASTSTIFGVGQVPITNGKPASFLPSYQSSDGKPHWVGVGTEWGGAPPLHATVSPGATSVNITNTSIAWVNDNPFYGFREDINHRLSGLIGVAGMFDAARQRFLSSYWNHYWPSSTLDQKYGLLFKEYAVGAANGYDPGPLDLANYDGSDVFVTTSGNSIGPAGISCVSGWDVYTAGMAVLIRGSLHIPNLNAPQFYWVGRYRSSVAWATSAGQWRHRIENVGAGVLTQETDYAAVLNPNDQTMFRYECPFPGSSPLPLSSIADGPIVQDLNFIVVGQSPASWAAQYGYSFGDTFHA